MAGQSAQEKAASKQYSDLTSMGNYTNPYSYTDKVGSLDRFYKSAEGDLNNQALTDTALSNKNTVGRLASQGITSGGLLNSAVASGANNINKNKYTSLSQLKTAQAGQNANAMDQANADKLNEYMALLRKQGMIGNAIGGLDNDTWTDDVLGGLSTVANLATGAGALGWNPFGKKTGA